MKRTLTSRIHSIVNVGASMLLALIIGLRPIHIDALLLHQHGDEGHHAHAVSLASGESLEDNHLRLHALEHHAADVDSAAHHVQCADTHNEDCSPLVIDFGEDLVARNPSRTSAYLTVSIASALDFQSIQPFVASQFTPAPTIKNLRPHFVGKSPHALDAILASSCALLV